MVIFVLALMAAPAPAGGRDSPPPQLAKLIENCDARKFETVIEVPVGVLTKHSRLKLCGTEGQSDADWVKTLQDAVAKTEANAQMPKAVRDQIITALNGEIARLAISASGLSGAGPRAASKTPVLDGISALPPLPEPKPAETGAALPPPRMIAPRERTPEYATLPPLPTRVTAPTHVLGGGLSPSLPALPKPRIRFICLTPGELGDGPCAEFTRDTLLTVQADEDLPNGTSLRFVRNGDARADVELAQLRKGKMQQFALPPEVCSHVSGATLEIRIVRAVPAAGPSGQEVGKDGPYNLRC